MRFLRIIISGIGIGGLLCLSAHAADDYDRARALLDEAFSAHSAEDFVTVLAKAAEAAAIRPDHARFQSILAAAHALNGDADSAADVLHKLASWGIHLGAAGSPAFDPVRDDPKIQNAFAALKANQQPRGVRHLAFELPANARLWEGIAYRIATQETFHSDLYHATLHRRYADGKITPFATMPTAGFGCGGLAVDEPRALLWVSSPAMPEVHNFTPDLAGRSQLVAFNLTDGSVARIVELPQSADSSHTVVDLTLATDGTVFAADSTSPVIWSIEPGADTAEVWATIDAPGSTHSLQGTALSGDEAWLFVADYSTGIHAIATDTKKSILLSWEGPPTTTLLGIDGLSIRGNTLVASQNGVSPARVLAIELSLTAPSLITEVRTLAGGFPELTDPTLLTPTEDGFLIIGNAGWPHFGSKPQPDSPARTVPILYVTP
ncbi:hypothetical protein N9Z12_01675 [Opitutaceae bacterium]|nr:hypothetical protein [Opitutaceae bacterium]